MAQEKNITRRNVLKLSVGTAILGSAGVSQAHDKGVQTPFNVGQVYIPIAGSSQEFPVRRIYCIGRNYAAHAREMGSDPTR
jgi:2-keto-4-pentenoate hydratase/2-oxohepta-3-ene-1,7-dioic acid hydratase in catechol pathway